MPDDEITKRIERLEEELADLKAVHGAEEALRQDAQRLEPYGLQRLRNVKRKEGLPNTESEER